jgi:uncharacterized protein
LHHFQVKSSKLILGTVQFGLDYGISNSTGQPLESEVFEMLDLAAESGISILDTADAYGNASEILGKYNALYPEKFEINTKFTSSGQSLSEQLEISLAKLQKKHVLAYFYHSYNDFVNYAMIQAELKKFKNCGKIANVGLSVYNNVEFRNAIDSEMIDVIQFPFNLLDNRSQRGELMQLAKIRGKELQVRSVFLQGLFFKSPDKLPSKFMTLKPYLQKIHQISKEYKLSIEQLSLLYALQQPEIDYVIIGVDNLKQLKHNLNIMQQNITTEIIDIINQIKVKETELLYPKNWN